MSEYAKDDDEALTWATPMDGSIAGLVYHVKGDGTKTIYLGSVMMPTTKQSDMRSITEWGNEVSAKQLREWADRIDPPKES